MTKSKQGDGESAPKRTRSRKQSKTPSKGETPAKGAQKTVTTASTQTTAPKPTTTKAKGTNGSRPMGQPPLPPTLTKERREKGTPTERPVPITAPESIRGPGENVLFFTPYAWGKLKFMCHAVKTEIGGMGISHPDDPMTIVDIAIIKQKVSAVGVSFDPDALAEYTMEMCDPEGEYKLKPVNCMRVWIHTHPAGMSNPSQTDEENFKEAFGMADWAIMFIMPQAGDLYVRLRATVGGVEIISHPDVALAWHLPFEASNHEAWIKEIQECVTEQVIVPIATTRGGYWGDGISARRHPRAAVSTGSSATDARTPHYAQQDWWDDDSYWDGMHGGAYQDGYNPAWWDEIPRDPLKRQVTTTQHSHKVPKLEDKTKPKEPKPPKVNIPRESIIYLLPDNVISKIIKHPIRIDGLTETIINALERQGIHLVGDDKEGNALFQCMDENGQPQTLTSDKLVYINDKKALSPSDPDELKKAEDDMQDLASDRVLGDEILTDMLGETIEMVYPWTCLDGTQLWLSQKEWDLLDDVRRGTVTLEQAYADLEAVDDVDVPLGTFTQDDFSVGDKVLVLFEGVSVEAEVGSLPPRSNNVQITFDTEDGSTVVTCVDASEILDVVDDDDYSMDDIAVGHRVTFMHNNRQMVGEVTYLIPTSKRVGVRVEFTYGDPVEGAVPLESIIDVEDPADDEPDEEQLPENESFLDPEAEDMQTGFFLEDGSFRNERYKSAWDAVRNIVRIAILNGDTVESIEDQLDVERTVAVEEGHWMEFDIIRTKVREAGYDLDGLGKALDAKIDATAQEVTEALEKGEAV